MNEDIPLPFDLPAVARKKVSAAFDGGRITSDGGVMLLAQAEHRLGIADQLARVIPDERDADRVVHLLPDILRARIFAIACGYEDGDDLDRLRFDPAFKLACGRLPDTGRDLCSQPTVSRWENAPSLRDIIRLMRVMVDLNCASHPVPPVAVTLDIDDTVDVVHGLVRDEIIAVFVRPRLQKRGRGKALMTTLESEARTSGETEIRLSISLPSKRFYESLGYKVLEEISRDVGEG
jgi:GNAT superfamily N-acetyltransferase